MLSNENHASQNSSKGGEGQASTVLDLTKNVYKSIFEDNMKLQPSELVILI